MTPVVVILSGRIAAGKTTLADRLARELKGTVVRTRDLLAASSTGPKFDRSELQVVGRERDEADDGQWLVDAIRGETEINRDEHDVLIVDSVRTPSQVSRISSAWAATHVHLTAPHRIRAARFAARSADSDSYARFEADPTEMLVDRLIERAHVVIDTGSKTPTVALELAVRAIAAQKQTRLQGVDLEP